MNHSVKYFESIVRRLSGTQRELLVDHIDQGAPVRPQQALTRSALLALDLIRSTRPHDRHPRRTVLTEKGRMVLAMLLGQYADALVKAGYALMPSGFLDGQPDETPMQVLERLKAKPVRPRVIPLPDVSSDGTEA